MAYRISYDDNVPTLVRNRRDEEAPPREIFETEQQALSRARELIEEGDCQAVAVCDDSGEVLGGIRLQLKLGYATE